MKQAILRNNFSSGIISQQLSGRIDLSPINRETHKDIIDIDGFNFVLSELKLRILWLKETTVGLVLGSSQGIGIIKTDSGQLTPFNFGCNIVSKDGSSIKDPIIVGTTLLYVDSTLKRLKTLTYSWNVNAFVNTNLNILCPELIQELIKKICKITLPQGINIGCFRIGHNYTSYLKTMNLGGMIESYNTMIAKKNISKVYARLYNSWRGKSKKQVNGN